MTDSSDTTETELVKCETCLKEIPRSEAKMAEVQEYVMHFCGLDCYDKWQEKSNSEAKENDQ